MVKVRDEVTREIGARRLLDFVLRLLCKYESSSDSLLAGICRHGLGLDLHPSPLNPNLHDVAIIKVRQIPSFLIRSKTLSLPTGSVGWASSRFVLFLPLLFLAASLVWYPCEAKVYLGIDVLAQGDFQILRGKRVGLLTHPPGVNRKGVSTIDVLLNNKSASLVALFGPEHGIYGDEKASVPVENQFDRRTGLPVRSLYGKLRKPTPEMLEGIDVLVIDLQDIGVRSYTFVSAMRLSMEACFKKGVEVVVLDRPNPLGGLKVDGPFLEKRWMSYVGAFRLPYVHGLTIGELAKMAKEVPGWMDVDRRTQQSGKLTVIPMRGWQRDMMWPDTRLKWIQTSPAIKDLSAVLGYAMTGLGCQLGDFSHGYGWHHLFRIVRYPGKSPEEIRDELSARGIPGLEIVIVPVRQPNGRPGRGAYLKVKDWRVLRPTEVSFHMMQIAVLWSGKNPFSSASEEERILFNKHVGSTGWWKAITRDGTEANLDAFLEKWQSQARVFQAMSHKYWLY